MAANYMVRTGLDGLRRPAPPAPVAQPLPRAAYAMPQIDQDWLTGEYLTLAAMSAAKQAQKENRQ